MPVYHHSLLVMQAVPAGTYASNNSSVSSTNTYPAGPAAGTQGASSAAGVSQDPHGALADETISLDSASHSVGASRAALAGSSFADSEASADRQSYHGLDIHGSAYDYGSQGASGAAPAPEVGVGSFRPGVQVSSTPILGSEGTYTVQPLSYTSPPAQQQQHTPAVVASTQALGQNGTAAAASYSSLNSSKGVAEARHVEDSSAIEVGRSSGAGEALQRGRAEAANSGLQDERSLRSFFSSGRDHLPLWQARHMGQDNWRGHTSCTLLLVQLTAVGIEGGIWTERQVAKTQCCWSVNIMRRYVLPCCCNCTARLSSPK